MPPPGNADLRKSLDEDLPVRVIRGYTHKSAYSHEKGYTYGGLYSVINAWVCPNHHVMFDRVCFSVEDDLELVGEVT